jgi:molybdopterin-containing oxidoreductase family membrane subunit
MFPGMDIIEGYGGIAKYVPSLPETLLGIGGIAVSIVAVIFFIKFLPFLPESLADEVADPHHKV